MRIRLFSAALVAAASALVTVSLTAGPGHAASLTEVTGFGSNPGNLRMFRYVPDGLGAGRPVVVALHGCTQDAQGYATGTGWPTLADRWEVAVVFPQQSTANNMNKCFNWFAPGDQTRGSGEALSIRQMVDKTRADLGSGTAYATGLSAGGAMAAVMLATYPDVFSAGAVVAGIPYLCASNTSQAFQCMNPGVDRTPAAWGDKVRAASGHTGPWPRVSVWHGTGDTTVKPVNQRELVDQWTNVHGTDQNPDVSDTVAGYPHKVYRDRDGRAVVETYEITDMAHGESIDPGTGSTQCGTAGAYFLDYDICTAYHVGRFWGLSGTEPPGTSPSPTPSPTVDCYTASNYHHVQAGRAYTRGGYTYATGSDQYMGLYNTYVTHTLAETRPDYYVIADDGCP